MRNKFFLFGIIFKAGLFMLTGQGSLAAQDFPENDFIHYTSRNGLNANEVFCIQQDEYGYIWIGTEVGLNRFDGQRFINFDAATPALPVAGGRVRKLKHFGLHEMAIIGEGGFLLLNTKDFSFKKYLLPDPGVMGALRNKAWDAAPLPGNNYAVSSAAGFYVYNQDGKVQYRYDAYLEKDIGNKRILFGRNIFPLSDKDLVVFTDEFGLSHFNIIRKELKLVNHNDKNYGVFTHPDTNSVDHWIFSSQISSSEFIFVQYSRDTIIYYDHKRNLRKAMHLPFVSKEEFGWNSKVVQWNDSVFLVSSQKGLLSFQLNRETGEISFNPQKFLSSFTINDLFLDKDKRLWIGTNNGVLCQKQSAPPVTTHSMKPASDVIQAIGYTAVYRYKDKLYLGRGSQKVGLVIADAQSMKIEREIQFEPQWQRPNLWEWNEVRSIQMYHPDTLWIGSNAGIMWLDTKTQNFGKVKDPEMGLPIKIVAILAPPHPDGTAWMVSMLDGKAGRYHIASRRFEWFTEKTSPALPFNKVKNIAYDAYGDVWISGHALARWNNKQNRFDTLINIYSGPNKYNDDIIAFSADDRGSLWMHNVNNGLLEYKIAEGKWVHYSTAQGLPNAIASLSPVVNNVLWMANANRLVRFNTLTKNIKVFTYEDGVSGSKPTYRKMYYDPEGRKFYYACENDIVSFSVDSDIAIDKSSGLLFQELNINSSKSIFEPKDGIRLSPDENNLFLHFTIIDYDASDGYRFAYRLNDNDNWQSLDDQRVLALTKLAPGNYKLSIRAIGKSGIEKIRSLQFTIITPLWERSWFRLVAGLLFVFAVIAVYRYRINQVRHKANVEKQISELETMALRAQMNPHFIFNSLNSIREMILNNENNDASRYLSKFAHLMRVTLDQSAQSYISLRQTIDYLNRYIEMEQIRNALFTYEITVDKRLDVNETLLPSMLLQPFIENSIWHGSGPGNSELNIRIDFRKENDQLVCIVEDNGIGIEQSVKNKATIAGDHRSVGIDNVRNRIRLLSEESTRPGSITIEDKSVLSHRKETGTLVTLRLPLETTT